MKRVQLFLILIIFTNSLSTYAQQTKPYISFGTLKHDFGTLKEESGIATFKFEFINTGAEPLIITNVQTSCGCTTPGWSREPVKPGITGYVDVQFDPRGRPGDFYKTITVSSNATNSPVTLIIQGSVTEKPKTIAEIYPYKMDELRLKTNVASFNQLYNDKKDSVFIDVINTSATNIKLSFENEVLPKYIKISVTPTVLKPNETGKIKVVFNAIDSKVYDFVSFNTTVLINNTLNKNNRLIISAIVREKFSEAHLKNPPKLELSGLSVFDFGTIKKGSKPKYNFTFTNTGTSDLYIRTTRSTCDCIVITTENKAVKPGKKGNILVQFNSDNLKGSQTKLITVVTNCPDPNMNKIILKVTGNVTE